MGIKLRSRLSSRALLELRFALAWLLAAGFVISVGALTAFAQTSSKPTWEGLRAEALAAYMKGDKNTATSLASQAVSMAIEQFGEKDWRTVADLCAPRSTPIKPAIKSLPNPSSNRPARS